MATHKKNVTFDDPKFEETVMKWYNDLESDYSDVEGDDFHPEDNFPDPESEGSDNDELGVSDSDDNDSQESEDTGKYYFGKNRYKWSSSAPVRNVRTPKHNIVSHLPGLSGSAKNIGKL